MELMLNIANRKRQIQEFFNGSWKRPVLSQRDKGILCLLGSAASFAFLNFFIKLSGDIPAMQKSLFRNSMAFLLTLVLMRRFHISFRPQNKTLPLMFARAALGTVGIVCNFYAVDHLLLADATMIGKTAPFFTVLFCAILLKEKLRLYQIIMLILAFLGSLLIIKPEFSVAILPAVVALAGGIVGGLAYSLVRVLGMRGENKILIIFFFSAFSTAVTVPFVIFDYTPMTWQQFGYLILAGIAACGGQLGVTYAYNYAPANEISVFDYFQVLVAALLGFLFLDQFPDAVSIIGYLVIIGSAVAIYLLNKKHYVKN